jgi:hypothetical protein
MNTTNPRNAVCTGAAKAKRVPGDGCGICGASDWELYPNPHPSRSMLSDFRILDVPLNKMGCRVCGSVRRDAASDHDTLFTGYELYAHDVGDTFENARQRRYAAWLADAIGEPESAFEAGAGNGSLQMALREVWPSTTLRGLEPSRAAVERAAASGAAVECGFVTGADSPSERAEIAFAVNVIEHVSDPVDFLSGLAQHATSHVVVVCPDGSAPWSELLFADHLRSLPDSAVGRLFAAAGLAVESQQRAPSELGRFIMTIGRRNPSAADTEIVTYASSIHQQRADYFRSWADLDGVLAARADDDGLLCFGAGETAAMLRAYAPRTWSTVRACVVDGDEARFGDLPVVPYESVKRSSVLLGIQPAAQERLAGRLRVDGHRPIRWDDIVAA